MCALGRRMLALMRLSTSVVRILVLHRHVHLAQLVDHLLLSSLLAVDVHQVRAHADPVLFVSALDLLALP